MKYEVLLKKSINKSGMSLNEICKKLEEHGFKTNKSHLSKLQNGAKPPARDKLNNALSVILNVDPLELKVAAYREKIPGDVLKRLSNEKQII